MKTPFGKMRLIPNSNQRELREFLWRALKTFNLYRLIVSITLFVVFYFAKDANFGGAHPVLYEWTAALYFGFSILCIGALVKRWPSFHQLVILQTVVDITTMILMMHASGGLITILVMLLLLSVSISCLLLGRYPALVFPSAASIAIMLEQFFALIYDGRATNYFQAGVVGATLFAFSLLALLLAQRMRESEARVDASTAGMLQMEKINEQIIQYMNRGVMVVDQAMRVSQINQSAWDLLGMPPHQPSQRLEDLNLELAAQLRAWQHSPEITPQPFRTHPTGPQLMPTFMTLGEYNEVSLIFLEDMSEMTQQAQNMKLASLGRLTASIAHEIRNPLAAVSHAGQLLAESDSLPETDKKLTGIIQKHCQRMNSIIENILQLSQRRRSTLERLPLQAMVEQFLDDFLLDKNPAPEIERIIEPPNTQILFDRSQLMQVLANLVGNALRHTIKHPGKPHITLHGGVSRQSSNPFLDVIDYGEGIAPDVAEQIFEPFFTTAAKGSGLGLYLSRELCEANRARLNYLPIPTGGSCFRISFSSVPNNPVN